MTGKKGKRKENIEEPIKVEPDELEILEKYTEKKIETPLSGELIENRVIVSADPCIEEVFERGYGKILDDRLELSLVEALYLIRKNKLEVFYEKKKMEFMDLMKYGLENDSMIHTKFVVYNDLRERGLTIKTGYKFGCHFRVYERGVKIKRGPKDKHEHTKWIVFCVAEDYVCSFPELSRAVRLAHNIRAKMLWAIVDTENDVTYYRIERIKP